MLERHLLCYGVKASLALYVYGEQAVKKQHAAKIREAV